MNRFVTMTMMMMMIYDTFDVDDDATMLTVLCIIHISFIYDNNCDVKLMCEYTSKIRNR